ncbi:hypothetical protein ACM66B_006632 [Microbotryomycetes sp. NB124-2]
MSLQALIQSLLANTPLWKLCLVALAVFFVLHTIYVVTLHPLADVPGPFLAKFTDAWKARESAKGRYVTSLREAHAKWGNVVRIGPNEVSVTAPEDIKTMYGHGTSWLKGPFYPPWSLGEPGHFAHTHPNLHALGRRAVAAAYSTSNLLKLEHGVDVNIPKLFGCFERAEVSNKVVEATELISWFTYDTMSAMSFGKPFGFLDLGEDIRGILPILTRGTALLVFNGCFSSLGWISTTAPFQRVMKFLLGDKGPIVFVKFSMGLVEERLRLKENDPESYEEKQDMLAHFLKSVDPATKQPLTKKRVINECKIMVIAGADTTKTSICAFLRYVYDPQNAATLQKLRDEIATAINVGKLSFPVQYSQGSRLEFMQACIKEANRMHPAVGMTLQRVAPPGGAFIGGRFFKEGTLVGQSAWEVHYDERAYGKDAHFWRPERWLEENAKADLQKYNLAFGQGARVCLGKNISMMEMLKLLPSLVWHWDLVFENEAVPFKVNESWFTVPRDMKCRLRRRDV